MMAKKKPSVFTLIGDIVGSRSVQDRSDMQQRLTEALAEMSQALEPLMPFEVTIGDEFQACFANPGAAVRASLIVRLALLRSAGVDSRYGLGAGEVEVFSQGRPVSQDGPGWWAARDAVEQVQRFAASPQTAFVRTFFRARALAF